MRALLLASTFFFIACAGPRIAPHYSAPSVNPVRQRIATAQNHLGRALEIAKQAKTAPTLELKNQFIDQLAFELVTAQRALKESEAKALTLQGQVIAIANSANIEAAGRSTAEAHDAATSRRYHTVKFYLCSVAAAAAALLAFQFRWILALLGPWGMLAGIGGLPAVVFGALWVWL